MYVYDELSSEVLPVSPGRKYVLQRKRYRNNDYVDVRSWYRAYGVEEFRPKNRGLFVKISELKQLMPIFQKILSEYE